MVSFSFIALKWSRWGMIVLLSSGVGCQTTGDPRRGGLFGWSETKAMARQEALRNQMADSIAAERKREQTRQVLEEDRSTLQAQVAARQERYAQLQNELRALRRAIETGELTPVAAARRADELRGPVTAAEGAGSDRLREDFAEIDRQINLLTQ